MRIIYSRSYTEREFSDTNLTEKNTVQLNASVIIRAKASAKFFRLKLVLENSLFRLCRSRLRKTTSSRPTDISTFIPNKVQSTSGSLQNIAYIRVGVLYYTW